MIKVYEQTDYPLLKQWWEQYGWQPVSIDALPSTGYIINNVCAGFLYKTDSSIAWLEWVVADKSADKELKTASLDMLIQVLIEDAKLSGYKTIFSSIQNESLMNRYLKHGFTKSDANMTNFVRSL